MAYLAALIQKFCEAGALIVGDERGVIAIERGAADCSREAA
jgi:hypothetical protein